jgi:DNA-binding CsgD family transcriptional regulator
MHGNPLALVELPYGLTPTQLAGGFGLPTTIALASQIEDGYRARLAGLSEQTRSLLLLVAADPTGDAELLWRAAAVLGIGTDAAGDAERARLLMIDGGVRFYHPLIRSTVYREASTTERAAAHRALAEATDGTRDPDRKAWHLARASIGPDDALADELERLAGRAKQRGGLAAAAAFFNRSAELTVDAGRSADRRMEAARAKLDAGAIDAADDCLHQIDVAGLGAGRRLQTDLLGAQIESWRSLGGAVQLRLLDVARRLAEDSPELARETYLEALETAVVAGRLGLPGGVVEVARACAEAPPARQPPRAMDLLLDGVVARYLEGHAAAVPTLRQAITAFSLHPSTRWLDLILRVALDLWDSDAADQLAQDHVRLARSTGALGILPLALNYLAIVRGSRRGCFAYGDELVDEATSISWATGREPRPYAAMMLAAERGNAEALAGLRDESLQRAHALSEGSVLTHIDLCTCILQNGLGNYQAAAAAGQAAADGDHLGMGLALPELIEAALRCDQRSVAQSALDELDVQTSGGSTGFGSAMLLRSRALLCSGAEADELYGESVSLLEASPARIYLARTHLVWGEALRREGHRSTSREHLRIAFEQLDSFGAEGFARRARGELNASGEHARARLPETRGELTAQESRIARLARRGLSNPEIAAQLFLSRRTVEYHLHNVYVKLGIKSRAQLDRALPEADEAMSTAHSLVR